MTTHYMHLNESPFEKIRSGKKTIELRLYDEKRQKVSIGDVIVFDNLSKPGVTISAVVIGIHRFDNFDELFESLPLQKCGYSDDEVRTASPDDMLEYYSAEEQQKYGVVGIEIKLIK